MTEITLNNTGSDATHINVKLKSITNSVDVFTAQWLLGVDYYDTAPVSNTSWTGFKTTYVTAGTVDKSLTVNLNQWAIDNGALDATLHEFQVVTSLTDGTCTTDEVTNNKSITVSIPVTPTSDPELKSVSFSGLSRSTLVAKFNRAMTFTDATGITARFGSDFPVTISSGNGTDTISFSMGSTEASPASQFQLVFGATNNGVDGSSNTLAATSKWVSCSFDNDFDWRSPSKISGVNSIIDQKQGRCKLVTVNSNGNWLPAMLSRRAIDLDSNESAIFQWTTRSNQGSCGVTLVDSETYVTGTTGALGKFAVLNLCASDRSWIFENGSQQGGDIANAETDDIFSIKLSSTNGTTCTAAFYVNDPDCTGTAAFTSTQSFTLPVSVAAMAQASHINNGLGFSKWSTDKLVKSPHHNAIDDKDVNLLWIGNSIINGFNATGTNNYWTDRVETHVTPLVNSLSAHNFDADGQRITKMRDDIANAIAQIDPDKFNVAVLSENVNSMLLGDSANGYAASTAQENYDILQEIAVKLKASGVQKIVYIITPYAKKQSDATYKLWNTTTSAYEDYSPVMTDASDIHNKMESFKDLVNNATTTAIDHVIDMNTNTNIGGAKYATKNDTYQKDAFHFEALGYQEFEAATENLLENTILV